MKSICQTHNLPKIKPLNKLGMERNFLSLTQNIGESANVNTIIILTFILVCHLRVHVRVCAWEGDTHRRHMEVRGQPEGVGSLHVGPGD